MLASPMETALAGSITARAESPWCARGNPASLAAARGRSLHISFAPSSLGIEGYQEGAMMAEIPLDSTIAMGVMLDAVGVSGYREITGSAAGSIRISSTIVLGAALSLHSLAIDGYGSTMAPSVDLGALAWLTESIRFGAALENVSRGGVADSELPQRVSFGFALDLGRGVTFSLDGMHELRRNASILLGISLHPARGFTLRAGAASPPGTLALGASYESEGTSFEYGGAYTTPLGLRHSVGIGLRW